MIVLLFVLVGGWSTGREIARLHGGEAWAPWRLDGDEWVRHAEREWSRVRRRGLRDVGLLVVLPVGIILLYGALTQATAGGRPWPIGGELRLLAALLLSIGLPTIVAPLVAAWLHDARRHRGVVREAILGPRNAFVGGRFRQLVGHNVRPSAARVEPGAPSVLHLETARPTRWFVDRQVLRVPVPRDREGEAEMLAGRYRSEYGAQPSP